MVLKPGMVAIDSTAPWARAALWTEAAGYRVADDHEVEARRLVGLGATVLDVQEKPGLRWTVLADPEGNQFRVAG
jgi:hypothetical protein